MTFKTKAGMETLLKLTGYHAAWTYLAIFAVTALFFIGLTNDTKLLMMYASHMVKGSTLYTDLVDVNPPLIFLLYMLPAWLMNYIPVSPAIILHGSTLGAIILSMYLCKTILNGSLWRQDRFIHPTRLLVLLGAILIVLPFACGAFADREHLFFIFSLPWILTRLQATHANTRISLLAAIGFCIKPYNALAFLTLAFLSVSWKKPVWPQLFSRSNLIIGFFGFSYVVLCLICFSEYAIIAQIAQLAYKNITYSFTDKISILFAYALICALICHQFPLCRKPVWLGLCATCGAIYLLNGGWLYTTYLLMVPLMLMAGIASDKIPLRGFLRSPLKIIPIVAFCGIFLHSNIMFYKDIESTNKTGYPVNYHPFPSDWLSHLQQSAGKRFIWLSTQLRGSNVAILGGVPEHVFSYDIVWTLPWLVANPEHPKAAFIADALWGALARSMERYPDATVIVDVSPLQRRISIPINIRSEAEKYPQVKKLFEDYYLYDHVDKCQGPYLVGMCAYEFW